MDFINLTTALQDVKSMCDMLLCRDLESTVRVSAFPVQLRDTLYSIQALPFGTPFFRWNWKKFLFRNFA